MNKMKFRVLTIILVLSFSVFSQELSKNPKAVYNKNNKLIGITGLIDCSRNGNKNFTGMITRIELRGNTELYFDVKGQTFQFDFINLDNAARSELRKVMKRGDSVAVNTCARNTNKVWSVINIRFLTDKK
jgi:hypothetical protein